jgi:putative FmdB family regulatory protein
MPTYEYLCRKCGHEFETFQKMTDAPLKRCPKCRGAVKRKIGTGAGLLFKGSGFYITDYRSESYHSKAKAEKESASPKPAAKPDGKKPAAAATGK